jgi:hypothetical protein
MSERAALTKTSENKGKNPLGAKPKENFYESMDSPVEQIFYLQRTIGNQAVQRLIKNRTIQAKLKIGQPNDKYEQEADRVADKVMRMPEQRGALVNGHWSLGKREKESSLVYSHSSLVQKKSTCPECPEKESIQSKPIADQITPLVQRQVGSEEEEKIQTKPIAENITPIIQRQVDNSEDTGSKAVSDSDKTVAQGLIVEDSTTELGPGQMKKSQFLAQLQAAVYSTVESAVEGTGHTVEDCPYIKYWFMFYKFKNSQYIERAVHKYAPETSRAASARDYISIITVRVRSAAVIWAKTGKITGVPKDIPIGMGGTGLIGGLVSKIGSIFFKARAGGPRNADNLQAIQARLGSGRPLDSGVNSRIGSAFGQDFSHVLIHTDAQAAQLSDSLNARAFTIGKDVAFASGEYRPGTLIGDALIAHELAHVVQQKNASASAATMQRGETGCNTLEKDADLTAIGAVTSLWGKSKGMLKTLTENAIPRLRSGLRLQRCSSGDCPSGYYWTVVNATCTSTAAGVGASSCRWRCTKTSSGQPSVSGPPQARPIILPEQSTSGICTEHGTCVCNPPTDSDGNPYTSEQGVRCEVMGGAIGGRRRGRRGRRGAGISGARGSSSRRRSGHAERGRRIGRRVGPAFNDAQRANQSNVYVQPDGRYVVRGPRGREHIFEPDGTHLTTVDRSNSAHQNKVSRGERRPVTFEEFERYREIFR